MSPRHTTLYVLLLALLSVLVLRVEAQHGSTNQPAREVNRMAKAAAAKEELEEPEFTGTIFNEQEVPPMIELGKDMEELLADGYWYGANVCSLRSCSKFIPGSSRPSLHIAAIASLSRPSYKPYTNSTTPPIHYQHPLSRKT